MAKGKRGGLEGGFEKMGGRRGRGRRQQVEGRKKDRGPRPSDQVGWDIRDPRFLSGVDVRGTGAVVPKTGVVVGPEAVGEEGEAKRDIGAPLVVKGEVELAPLVNPEGGQVLNRQAKRAAERAERDNGRKRAEAQIDHHKALLFFDWLEVLKKEVQGPEDRNLSPEGKSREKILREQFGLTKSEMDAVKSEAEDFSLAVKSGDVEEKRQSLIAAEKIRYQKWIEGGNKENDPEAIKDLDNARAGFFNVLRQKIPAYVNDGKILGEIDRILGAVSYPAPDYKAGKAEAKPVKKDSVQAVIKEFKQEIEPLSPEERRVFADRLKLELFNTIKYRRPDLGDYEDTDHYPDKTISRLKSQLQILDVGDEKIKEITESAGSERKQFVEKNPDKAERIAESKEFWDEFKSRFVEIKEKPLTTDELRDLENNLNLTEETIQCEVIKKNPNQQMLAIAYEKKEHLEAQYLNYFTATGLSLEDAKSELDKITAAIKESVRKKLGQPAAPAVAPDTKEGIKRLSVKEYDKLATEYLSLARALSEAVLVKDQKAVDQFNGDIQKIEDAIHEHFWAVNKGDEELAEKLTDEEIKRLKRQAKEEVAIPIKKIEEGVVEKQINAALTLRRALRQGDAKRVKESIITLRGLGVDEGLIVQLADKNTTNEELRKIYSSFSPGTIVISPQPVKGPPAPVSVIGVKRERVAAKKPRRIIKKSPTEEAGILGRVVYPENEQLEIDLERYKPRVEEKWRGELLPLKESLNLSDEEFELLVKKGVERNLEYLREKNKVKGTGI